MRSSLCWIAALTIAASAPAGRQEASVNPERLLSERFQFSNAEVAQARQGQPVVKVQAGSEQLKVLGAIRLPGKKERLSGWVMNIEHFRGSAQLGVAHVIPFPPAPAAFAQLTLGSSDLAELQRCRPENCAIRLPSETLAQLQREPARATDIIRELLLGYTKAYLHGGWAGVTDMRALIGQASTLMNLAPQLVAYLDGFPNTSLAGVSHIMYWSSMQAGSASILSVHHLVVYHPHAAETWIVDQTVYATRYFDEGVLAIALYDAPDNAGFYAVAGSRVKSSQLGSAAATVLRRQIRRSAGDTVRTYLEWIRESLAQAP
jgi:hypothetical protein